MERSIHKLFVNIVLTIVLMEELTIDKDDLLAAYRTGTEDQKAMLEKLCGKDIFTSDWREITSYEKACDVLGIKPIKIEEIGERCQYLKMADAVQKLLVICEAINGNGRRYKWYGEDGLGYYPVFALYSKKEMNILGEAECKRKGIHQLLAATNAYGSEAAGVRFTYALHRGVSTNATYGFPICLNSKEKAEFVGKQFFKLCCQCYGLTPEMD